MKEMIIIAITLPLTLCVSLLDDALNGNLRFYAQNRIFGYFTHKLLYAQDTFSTGHFLHGRFYAQIAIRTNSLCDTLR